MPSFELSCGKPFISENIDEIQILESNDGLKSKIFRKDGLGASIVPWDPKDSILVAQLGVKLIFPSGWQAP